MPSAAAGTTGNSGGDSIPDGIPMNSRKYSAHVKSNSNLKAQGYAGKG